MRKSLHPSVLGGNDIRPKEISGSDILLKLFVTIDDQLKARLELTRRGKAHHRCAATHWV